MISKLFYIPNIIVGEEITNIHLILFIEGEIYIIIKNKKWYYYKIFQCFKGLCQKSK